MFFGFDTFKVQDGNGLLFRFFILSPVRAQDESYWHLPGVVLRRPGFSKTRQRRFIVRKSSGSRTLGLFQWVDGLVAEGFPQDRIERVGHLKLGFDIRAHKLR